MVDVTIVKSKYRNLKVLNGQIVVSIADDSQLRVVKKILTPAIVTKGTHVVLRTPSESISWNSIKDNYDLKKLDALLEFIKNGEGMLSVDDLVLARVKSYKREQAVIRALSRYAGSTYHLIMLGSCTDAYFDKSVSLDKLEMLIDKVNE